ncbi:MAG: DUF805 domain-containing protein [Selenomonadaceae bacterium]|nr:DUF805 domain-containing protein [Selenomonadaceae bacterium]
MKGRLNRSLHAKYQLIWIMLIVLAETTGSELASFVSDSDMGENISMLLFYIGLTGFSMILTRRLHDIDRSGWFALIALVPVIGFFFSIYLFFAQGTVGSNQYGQEPLTD